MDADGESLKAGLGAVRGRVAKARKKKKKKKEKDDVFLWEGAFYWQGPLLGLVARESQGVGV